MASQKLTSVDDDPQVLEINSYVRSYHAFVGCRGLSASWSVRIGRLHCSTICTGHI